MLLFYILNVLQLNSHTIIHDCDTNSYNPKMNETILCDYTISCPINKLQIINLSKVVSLKSLRISDKSNVFISCSPQSKKTERIKLFIYDEPYITFVNDCYFNVIEIFGAPVFKFSQGTNITIGKAILHNNSYQLPFKPQHIIYSHNNFKKHPKIFFQTCESLKFELSNFVNVICTFQENERELQLEYQDLIDYDFTLVNEYSGGKINIQNISHSDDNIYEHMGLVMSSISISNPTNAYFADFLNYTSLMSTFDTIKSTGSQIKISMNWKKYMSSYEFCPWEDGVYLPEYNYLQDTVNNLIEHFNFRKACIDQLGYLYLQDEKVFELIVISTAGSWGLIGGILGFVLLIFFVSIFIAYCQY